MPESLQMKYIPATYQQSCFFSDCLQIKFGELLGAFGTPTRPGRILAKQFGFRCVMVPLQRPVEASRDSFMQNCTKVLLIGVPHHISNKRYRHLNKCKALQLINDPASFET